MCLLVDWEADEETRVLQRLSQPISGYRAEVPLEREAAA